MIHRTDRTTFLVSATLLLLGVTDVVTGHEPPTADQPRVLIDRELTSRSIRLVSMSDEAVQVRDEFGRPLSISRRDVLAIVPPPVGLDTQRRRETAQRLESGWLRTVDGQVLPGTLAGGDGEQLEWDSRLWSKIRVRLDEVESLVLKSNASAEVVRTGSPADVVLLVNGDRIEGYVSAVRDSVRIDSQGKAIDVPIDRVTSVEFANVVSPASGARVWTYDGTIAAVDTVRVRAGGVADLVSTLRGESGGVATNIPASDVRAVSLDTSRLRALASLEAHLVEGSSTRRWTPPPAIGNTRTAPLSAADIEIPGPMRVQWNLPAGARKLATIAELPIDARLYGDCEIVVSVVTGDAPAREIARERLHAQRASVDLNLVLHAAGTPAGTALRIDLLSGEGGAIQDRVVLRRPLFLVE